MAQADGVIQNDTGSSVRADLNNNIAAAFTNHSGASAPSTTYAYQFFADTSSNELKIRNGANNGYITIGDLTATNLGLASLGGSTFTGSVEFASGTASAPGITFSSDTDTGLLRSAPNTLQFTLGGTAPFTFTSTAFATTVPITFADGTASAPSITNTGDTNCGLFFPSADKVGVSAGGTHQYSFDATSIDLLLQNEARFYDTDSSNYMAVKAPGVLGANYTLTLPSNDGDSGEFLQTNGTGTLTWATPSTQAGAVPTGAVFCMALITVPNGYLECNGAEVSRTEEEDLFNAIGTTYGNGNGTTTFNLPDLRGEFIRGWASDRRDDGVDPSSDAGRGIGTDQSDAVGGDSEIEVSDGTATGGSVTRLTILENAGSSSLSNLSLNNLGSQVSETRPRNVAMMYVIKT